MSGHDVWAGMSPSQQQHLVRQVHAEPTHDPAEVLAAVASSVIAEPGDATWGECVAQFGALAALEALIASADSASFAAALGVPADAALHAGWQRWTPRLSLRATTEAVERAARVGATVMLPGDPAWPDGLYDLGPYMPQVLYVRGQNEQPWHRAIALVGARAATGYGEHIATELAAELAASGCPIVSGAAYGIDGAAHRAALAQGAATVAFLAGGIDRLYPSGHTELLNRIVETGLVVSETPCGTTPSKWRFLQRNRLIAASTQATVVVEAGRRSGSLNTAGHAATLGRALGAVPGPITSPASAGCHLLLREFDAVCVTSAAEIRELVFGPELEELGEWPSAELVRLLDALGSQALTVEQIAARAGLGVAETSGLLAEAELRGAAQSAPNGWIRGTLRV